MGLQVEFNNVLALREHGAIGRLGNETVPPEPEEGVNYMFEKSGHRVYPIGKLIPLLVTKGNCQFIRLVGFVKIASYAVTCSSGLNAIVTGGQYEFIRRASQIESDFYLKLGSPQAIEV